MPRTRTTLLAAVLATALLAAPARGGSHLWVINEIFSNADGTIQFVELHECCGAANEIFLANKWVRSESTGNQFVFPANLPPGSTANKYLLLATECYAALPGAPAPDYIIQDRFFDTTQDTLTYWFYPKATMSFSPGELPLNGIESLDRDGVTGPNSPTNFSDESASVVAPCSPADLDADGIVGISDLLALLPAWGTSATCAADIDSDGVVGIGDLLVLLGSWGPCA
jgi:hypothetical protein